MSDINNTTRETNFAASRIIAADSLILAQRWLNDRFHNQTNRAVNENNRLQNTGKQDEMFSYPHPASDDEVLELAEKYSEYLFSVYEKALKITEKY